MRIVVLVKQVPDMITVKFDREKGVVDRGSAGVEVNPFDLNALEVAVQLKEKLGAEVIVLSMGPPRAEETLKDAISRGADSAYLMTDRAFGGADCKATSRTLAAGIRKLGQVDLVIAGLQTVDGDTGQVGGEVAQYLGMPGVCSVIDIRDASDKAITVVTNMWDGMYLKEITYPCLISVTKDVNAPRLASFKDKMRARKTDIVVWKHEDIADRLSAEEVGLKGSPTMVKKIQVPKLHERQGKLIRGNIPAAVETALHILAEKKVI